MLRLRLASVSLLSLATIATLSGCGGSGSNPTTSSSGTTASSGSGSGSTGSGSGSGSTGSGSGSASNAAYVYVASFAGQQQSLYGYAAASDGSLKPVPGSPFTANVSTMASNGKYLFGVNGSNIDSFTINSDGSVTHLSSANASGPGFISLDKTGQSLYDDTSNGFQAFNVQGNGSLTHIADYASQYPSTPPALAFTKDDKYGYAATCQKFNFQIVGFQRNADGSLTPINTNSQPPANPPSGFNGICNAGQAVSNDFHLFTTVTAGGFPGGAGPYVAVYSINSDGTLSTSSTFSNMPKAEVGVPVTDVELDPTSTYLAVAGRPGLQIFQTHGSSPVTKFTDLIVSGDVNQVGWDNVGHLYAVSASSNQLYVFNVSSSGVTPAPGSPYTVPGGSYVQVQPLK